MHLMNYWYQIQFVIGIGLEYWAFCTSMSICKNAGITSIGIRTLNKFPFLFLALAGLCIFGLDMENVWTTSTIWSYRKHSDHDFMKEVPGKQYQMGTWFSSTTFVGHIRRSGASLWLYTDGTLHQRKPRMCLSNPTQQKCTSPLM